MAAPFSPIIVVGAIVFADVIAGNCKKKLALDHARINYPKSINAMSSKPIVNYSSRIAKWTHFARTNWMKICVTCEK